MQQSSEAAKEYKSDLSMMQVFPTCLFLYDPMLMLLDHTILTGVPHVDSLANLGSLMQILCCYEGKLGEELLQCKAALSYNQWGRFPDQGIITSYLGPVS